MNAIFDNIAHHFAAYGFGAGAFLIAAISCMPEKRPSTIDDWYAYFRHSLQTAVPAARGGQQTPQQPEGPAQPKE